MPVSDWVGECYFAAVRAVWLEQLLVRGSSWGQQLEGKRQEEQDEIGRLFLEQCGAKPTSRGLSVRSLAARGPCSAAPAVKSVAGSSIKHAALGRAGDPACARMRA